MGTFTTSHATPYSPDVMLWAVKGKETGCGYHMDETLSSPHAPLYQPACPAHHRAALLAVPIIGLNVHPYLQAAEDTLAPGGWIYPRPWVVASKSSLVPSMDSL